MYGFMYGRARRITHNYLKLSKTERGRKARCWLGFWGFSECVWRGPKQEMVERGGTLHLLIMRAWRVAYTVAYTALF